MGQLRQINDLIEFGFDYVSLKKMSIEERNFHYHLMIEKFEKKNQKDPKGKPTKK